MKEIEIQLKLASSISHAPILDLSGGSRNHGLFLGSPRDKGRVKEHVITRERTMSTRGLISIGEHLEKKRTNSWIEEATRRSTFKITKKMHSDIPTRTTRGDDELAQLLHPICNIKEGEIKIEEPTNKVVVALWVIKERVVSSCKLGARW